MVRECRILWDNPSFCRSELDQLRRLDRGDDSFVKPRRQTDTSGDGVKNSVRRDRPGPAPSPNQNVDAGHCRLSPASARQAGKRPAKRA